MIVFIFLGYHKKMVVGTKAQVWHGTADKTSGGLTRDKSMQNKNGCIVSKAKHSLGKKQMAKMMRSKHAGVFKSNQQKVKKGTLGH
jgi:hypothetical protein